MLRQHLPRISRTLGVSASRRALHQVPLLHHAFEGGVPGLLSSPGFDIAWTQYQNLMVEKLNNLTVGGEYEHKTPKEILLKYARDPHSAPVFNYASMAHNNQFFFSCLSPNPPPMPDQLKRELEHSFSSIDTLRREMIITASSLFGPGFVWLVKTKDRKYSLLTTYSAGTPYPAAHFRKQPVDMNTEDKSVADAHRRMAREVPVNSVGSFGPHSREVKIAPGGADITPILCINMWEHVYLADYGVGAFGTGGKRQFAERWWETIDWSIVANYAQVLGSAKFQT